MQRVLLCCLLTVLLYSAWYHLSVQFCLARVKRLWCSQARKVWELLMRVTSLACECYVHTSFMMLRRSVCGQRWRGAGCFLLSKNGVLRRKRIICFVLYSILFIFSFAASPLPAVDVWFSVNLLHYWPTNLCLETWGNFVPVLQVSLDLSWVNKKNCCQCWDWNPVVTCGLLLTFYHLLAQRESQIIFFPFVFHGSKNKVH